MKPIDWDIPREGRLWSHDEFDQPIDQAPEKIEFVGSILASDGERLNVLGTLTGRGFAGSRDTGRSASNNAPYEAARRSIWRTITAVKWASVTSSLIFFAVSSATRSALRLSIWIGSNPTSLRLPKPSTTIEHSTECRCWALRSRRQVVATPTLSITVGHSPSMFVAAGWSMPCSGRLETSDRREIRVEIERMENKGSHVESKIAWRGVEQLQEWLPQLRRLHLIWKAERSS